MPIWRIVSSCVSSQSTCSSSSVRIDSSRSRLPWSPLREAQGDAVAEPGERLALDAEVGLELLLHGLADAQRAETLQVGNPFEVEDALDERLGVLHLLDRLVADLLAESPVAPVVAHLGVDEVLVDRRQLAGQHLVEQLENLVVATHGSDLRRSTVRR